jgi:putative FmdB family regulatory protein
MPIYEYRCGECGHQDEHLQKVAEKPLSKCPACGKKAYKKQLSAAGFQLKGSGWYATDFKGSGSKPAAKSEGSDGKPAAAKTEAKSETAAKTESKSEAAAPAAATPAATGAGPAAS